MEADRDAYDKHWFMYWGTANVHSDVKESEAKINRELNNTLGALIPGWKRPITMRDWSEDFLMWDGHIGVGRDLSAKWSWFIGTGGTMGTVKNDETYLFPIPLQVRADFTRRLSFVVTGVDYYPFGKPELKRTPDGSGVMDSLRGTRPFVELATSYVRIKTIGDVKVGLPDFVTLFKKYDECDYDLWHISPRVGVETPIGKNDTIAFQVGYLFFNKHPDEFNNLSFYLFHKHRF